MTHNPRPRALLALLVALLVGVTTACSSGSGANTAAQTALSTGPVTLHVGLFGTFGFKEAGLYAQYEKLHPNVTIVEDDVEQSADYWTRLKTRLASGSGLDDVQGIEIGFVADLVQNHASQFVDFNSTAAGKAALSSFYSWKNSMASTTDGKTLGLGTDAGPEAMCYRPSLLAKAGLPSERATLASQWATWDDFIAFGKKYEAAAGRTGAFLDSASSIFDSAVYQGTTAYDDTSGKPIPGTSDGVKSAWNYASQAAQAKITAGLSQFSDPWNKAFANGAFATIACPAWMLGYITSEAGSSVKGDWDVAPLPGGTANWGGSWLGVPTASKHQADAEALVEWLTAPAQQVTMWTSQAHFPSNQQAAENPAVAAATNAYFDNAPVGKIFGTAAAGLKRTPIGPYDTQIQAAFGNALANIEVKGEDPAKAFQDAMANISQITG